jgi:peptidoglycan/xylan/chitin deacetylase (PgdA/CDA1 family)
MPAARFVRRATKHLAVGADRLRPPGRGITVLIYHRVGGGTASEVDLPVEVFDEQLVHLCQRGPVLSLDDALVALDAPPGSGPDPVVVTFDDGTADFVDVALPVLERHRVPVTLYLASGFIDDARSFPGGAQPCSWASLRDALATGLVTVGSHTHRHRLLDRLPTADLIDELDRSIDRIGAELGDVPRHFAYPKALAPQPGGDAQVRARFASAAVAGSRPNGYGITDPYRLARTPIQVSDGMRFFRAKAAGGMAAEDWGRSLLNRRRYAGAAT